MFSHVVWAGLLAPFLATPSEPNVLPNTDAVALVAVCAQRARHMGDTNQTHAEIAVVAAVTPDGLVELDAMTADLPELLRQSGKQTWFTVNPNGLSGKVPGADLFKHRRVDADAIGQHVRLGLCKEPGTVYATHAIAPVNLPRPSDTALQPALSPNQVGGGIACLEQAWDHGNGRIEVLGRVHHKTKAVTPKGACEHLGGMWLMLNPPAPPTSAPKREARDAHASYTGIDNFRVTHIKLGDRVLTWVLDHTEVSVDCSIYDDTPNSKLGYLMVTLENLGC